MKTHIRRLLNWLGYEVYRYPEGCERLIPHLKQLLTQESIQAVIDVGANEGQFGKLVRQIPNDALIVSVEPNPLAFERLSAAARGRRDWTVVRAALGASVGTARLNITASDDFSSCLEPNAFGQQRFGNSLLTVRQVDVHMTTLDDMVANSTVLANRSGRFLLKLDTQGYDKEVLLGGQKTIERVDIVISEVSVRPIYTGAFTFQEAIEFMTLKGFSISGFFPVSRAPTGTVIEADCVFLRDERIEATE